jgi:uncharacterized membrane protein YdjX (TVP38/TMEM64 family)
MRVSLLLICNGLVLMSCPLQVASFVAPSSPLTSRGRTTTPTVRQMAFNDNNNSEEENRVIEESRRKVLESRRSSIRSTLKSAEQIKAFRLAQGWVPELDPETGAPKQSDGKAAVTVTAFAVAAGAIALRIGGRAALVSAVGLDFAKDNPELKEQMDSILTYADQMNLGLEAALFVAAWTAVKVFCFDAGGVVLALSAGILFGGVWQGALASATAATIGSLICFSLAKADTPVRAKALEVVEEYPSLRGIERVVAQDGFKAILTLRLAPILPIPLGMYNYVYGVTNVPILDFMAGIFLGSLKPYLLDSYLGYFGKTVMDGSAATGAGDFQDIILLLALGLSVLIGVFASQLAGETWDTVLQEVEAERKEKLGDVEEFEDTKTLLEKMVITKVAGLDIPDFLIDGQINWGLAEERMIKMVQAEYDAKVWNYTSPDLIPQAVNPGLAPDSPEVQGFRKGFDFQSGIYDGFVLSPVLFTAFSKFADPLRGENDDDDEEDEPDGITFLELFERLKREGGTSAVVSSSSSSSQPFDLESLSMPKDVSREGLLDRVSLLQAQAQRRLARLEGMLEDK